MAKKTRPRAAAAKNAGARLIQYVILLIVSISVVFVLSLGGEKVPQEAVQNASVTIMPGCGQLKVYVINVSQADGILVITPNNKTLLIDTGSGVKPNSSTNLVSFLKDMGITSIDALLLTHYHEDHIGGMRQVTEDFRIGEIYHNGNCGNYSSGIQNFTGTFANGHNATIVRHDMELELDDCLSVARLMVAYDRPKGCWDSSTQKSNENDNSILLRLVYGNTSFLFTGDCEGPCEQEMISKGDDLSANFMKAGHHGSATSSTPPFLAAIGADYFVISTDKNRSVVDRYYHPRQIPLGNIYDAGGVGKTYRTDLNGLITVASNGSGIEITTEARSDTCSIFSGYNSTNISTYMPILPLRAQCGQDV